VEPRMDVNKVWLSGVAFSEPVLTESPGKTPHCSFTLHVTESYTTRDGGARARSNFFKVEALGRLAPNVLQTVKKGARYFVEGYLRHDDSRKLQQVKVRAFAVLKDQGADQEVYSEALRQSIEILKSSRDKESALKVLEGLVAS